MMLLTAETQQANLGGQFLNKFDAAVRKIYLFPKAYALFSGEIRRYLIKVFPTAFCMA
ncbi:MAG: hypothetical protein WAW36_00760 [Methylovulum miyakonense]|uniref:hypothetical protein n=1 Tax=Methylovulum miyakonense TaxID=645578 RepID=UPI003BB777CB